MRDDSLLEVENLRTHFFTDEGVVRSVDGVDFAVRAGRTLCVLGESGCGKSVTARSILNVVDRPGRIVGGHLRWRGADGTITDIAALSSRGRAIRAIRGREIAMIFQEPMTALGPIHTIGDQISETILLHENISKRRAREKTIAMLGRVGIPDPERRFGAYPFQLSGGMRQRAMIALALCCAPRLLIADEPTTALDVTTQANILDLLRELQREFGMAVMFITHDLGVVAEIADDVVVMYLGKIVEQGSVDAIFHAPRHPYTKALLESVPRLGVTGQHRLAAIRGYVPHPFARPAGCGFVPRCTQAIAGLCATTPPELMTLADGSAVRCHLYAGEPA
jgi:oligopeptide/dipeptide ABC transporter ATP-binding protein